MPRHRSIPLDQWRTLQREKELDAAARATANAEADRLAAEMDAVMAVIMDGATWPGLTRDDDSWISRADFSAAYDAAHPDSLLDNRQLLAAVREGYAGKGSELRESRRGPHRGLYGFRLATVPAPARKGVRLDPGAALSLLEDTSFVGRQVTVTPGGFTSRIEVRQAADIWTIHTGHCLAPESIYAALLRLDGVRPGAVRLKGGRGFHGLARVA